jgi:rhamnosyltransferase
MDASVFPADGRRLVVYVVYDPRGEVEDHVLHALGALREHADGIFAVVNGKLTEGGRARLERATDRILVRDNRGFDIGAQRDALLALSNEIEDFDEVILTNDTWFGPVRPFGPVFARMDAEPLDFWGLTDHTATPGDGESGEGAIPRHLQSFWLAARRSMFSSEEWRRYWEQMPIFDGYWDAVTGHELVFTEHFERAGFVSGVAFSEAAYPAGNASVYAADLLLDDGCPVVKRRPFFHDPPFLARHAVVGRSLAQIVQSYGYPMEMFWSNLARTVAPRILHADCAMLEVLASDDDAVSDAGLRTLVIAHVARGGDAAGLRGAVAAVPGEYDVVVTTSGGGALVDEPGLRDLFPAAGRVEQFASPAGDDAGVIAFLDVCRSRDDLEDYDLVLKIGRSDAQAESVNAEHYRNRYAHENLVGARGYATRVWGLFRDEPGLGLVFPEMSHIGRSPSDREWGGERAVVARLRDASGIRVPWDDLAPLEPSESVWVVRPAALALLVDATREPVIDGDAEQAARAVRRLFVSTVAELGFHTRTVLTHEHAAISHTGLEYKVDLLSSTTHGWPVDQIQFLERAGWHGQSDLPSLMRIYVRIHRPALAARLASLGSRVRGLRPGRRQAER